MLPNPRDLLENLCAERGENFAALSRLVGRNPAYIQQYVRKGTPKYLPERERRILARYFDIPEASLGGPDGGDAPDYGALVPVRRADVFASAGPGAVPDHERRRPYFGFDQQWLRRLTATPPDRLEVIRVEGDSMAPTLNSGDDILVDPADAGERLRDGIYVIRADSTLLVKRLAIHPVGRRVTVQSDNPAYGDLPDCGLDEIECIGRVIWAGRRIA